MLRELKELLNGRHDLQAVLPAKQQILILVFVFFAFMLLLFFSACISQEERIQLKQQCIDLSSEFYSGIPECFSQEKCFEEVGKAFFKDTEMLPENIQAKLFLLKNLIARSWFYFNLSRNEIRKINESCSNEDFSSLESHLNNARHYLLVAFEESDNVLKQELQILLTEQAYLKTQDINLVHDVALFDSYIELNDNINIFVAPDAFNDSFIKKYFSSIESFNHLSEQKGLKEGIIKEKTPLDLIAGLDLLLFDKLKKENTEFAFFIPFVAKGFHSIVSFFIETFELKRSVPFLQQFPAFEFFSIYSQMLSVNDSVTSKFSILLTQTARNSKALQESNERLLISLDENLSYLFSEYNELKNSFVSSQEAEIKAFQLYLNEETLTFQSEDFSSSDLDSMLYSANLKLNEIKENSFSLGKMHSKLMELRQLLSLIIEKINLLREKPLQLKGKCSFYLDFIKQKISSFNKKAFSFEEVFLFNSIEKHLNAFQKASAFSESIFHCTEFISAFKKLDSLLIEKSLSEKEKKLRAEKEKEEQNEKKAFFFSFEFNSLLEKAKKKASIIMQISGFFPSLLGTEEKLSIEKKLAFFESFNDSNSIEQTLNELNAFNLFLDSKLKQYLAFYLKNTFKTVNLAEEALIGTEFDSMHLIEFFNPFDDLNYEIAFSLSLDFKALSIEYFSSNISIAQLNGNELLLSFSKVPSGKSFVKINGKAFIPFSYEDVLLREDDNTAFFKRKISIKNNAFLRKAILSTELPVKAKALSVSFNERLVSFTEKERLVFISLENAKEKSVIEVFYAITKESKTNKEKLSYENSLIERIYLLHSDIDRKLSEIEKAIMILSSTDNQKLLSEFLEAKEKISSFKEKSLYFLNKDLKLSLSYAEQALSYKLPKMPDFSSVKEELLSKVNDMKSLLYLLPSVNPKIKDSLDSIEKSILSMNSSSFADLNSISKQLNNLSIELNEKARLSALYLKEDIEFILSSVKENSFLFKDIDFLLSQLKSVPEKELINAKYSTPFTEKDLISLKDSIEAILSAQENRKFEEFLNSVKRQEFIEALHLINANEINKKKLFLLQAKDRLSLWKQKLEEDAQTLLSMKANAKNIMQAESLIRKKEFLKAIALLSLNNDDSKTIDFLYLIPFALLILVLVAFKVRKKEVIAEPIKLRLPRL